MANYTREQMRDYQASRRATNNGFRLNTARWLYYEMLNRGIDAADARWAVIDAARHGCFGNLR